MKFTIVNKTRFRSRHLRAFVTRSYKIACELAGPDRTRRYEMQFRNISITFARSNRRENGASTGHAHYWSTRAHVGVHDQCDRIDLALTIAHEIGHCLGLRHDDMRGGPLDAYHWRTEDDSKAMRVRVFGWAASLPLDPTPATRPTAATRDQRRAALTARLERWQAKQRRAQNAVKRLQSKIKAHDRYQPKLPLAA